MNESELRKLLEKSENPELPPEERVEILITVLTEYLKKSENEME